MPGPEPPLPLPPPCSAHCCLHSCHDLHCALAAPVWAVPARAPSTNVCWWLQSTMLWLPSIPFNTKMTDLDSLQVSCFPVLNWWHQVHLTQELRRHKMPALLHVNVATESFVDAINRFRFLTKSLLPLISAGLCYYTRKNCIQARLFLDHVVSLRGYPDSRVGHHLDTETPAIKRGCSRLHRPLTPLGCRHHESNQG